jgi:hypothetical protein
MPCEHQLREGIQQALAVSWAVKDFEMRENLKVWWRNMAQPKKRREVNFTEDR